MAVQDNYGNTITTDTSSVTLTLSGGTFSSGGSTVTVAAVGGIATFSNLVISQKGPYVLAAGDGGLAVANSNFTVCSFPGPTGNATVDASDIDQIYANFGQAAGVWDLNGDGVVNQADVDCFVKTILHTNYGDANLDCKVDFYDFQQVMYNWQSQNAGWAHGDFNGDGVVDYNDFQLLLNNWNPVGIGLGPVVAIDVSSSVTSAATSAIATAALAAVATTPAAQPAVVQTSAPVAAAIVADSLRVLPSTAVTSPQSQSAPSAAAAPLVVDNSSGEVAAQDDGQVDILTQLCTPVLN